MKKDSFILYCSLRGPIKRMQIEEAGALFVAILDYVAEGIEPKNLSSAADIAFAFVRDQIDRDSKKYIDICEKRAEAGRKGGLQKQANLASANKSKQAIENIADTDSDTGSDSDTELKVYYQEVSKMQNKYGKEFEEFWSVYPRRVDKAQAYKQYKARRNEGYSAEELLVAADEYRKQCEKNRTDKQYIKHAKTFLGSSLPFTDFTPKRTEKINSPETPGSGIRSM